MGLRLPFALMALVVGATVSLAQPAPWREDDESFDFAFFAFHPNGTIHAK
jgi:hypothetical protein